MSLLRPQCVGVARRLWNSQTACDQSTRSSILSCFLSRRQKSQRVRCFTSSSQLAANVYDPPKSPKRTIRIGPLPDGPVDEGSVNRIFGRKLSPAEGNNVLRILQHRRSAGSLADYGVDNLGSQYTHVNRNMALKGLEWLRKRYPMDEARAAEEWAEKEANRISYELWLADPETESKYKDPARAFKEQMEKEEQARNGLDGEKIGILHAGKSQFELNIEEKRRERLEEVTRKAEKERRERDMEAKLATGEWVRTPTGTQLMKPGQTTYVDIFGREQVSRRKEEMEKYSKASQVTESQSLEELMAKTTLTQRLYPMTAFVLLTIVMSVGFAYYYLPPSPNYRLFPDLSPTTATIGTIVALNIGLAVAWRIMPLWPFMMKFFIHVPAYPRAFQAIGNVFSQFEHLLGNMFMLGLAGIVCHDLVGRGVFMGTYISAGAVGTLASLYWANIGRGNIVAHSLGASAAIWGVAALYCLLTEAETIKLPFFEDKHVTFWPKTLLAAFVVMEVANAVKRRGSFDHASHFGGMAVGMATAGYLRATGFHEKRFQTTKEGGNDGVQQRIGGDSTTVELGAMANEMWKEVKNASKK